MTVLRVCLFLGLAFHKLVWEVLKKRDGNPVEGRQHRKKPLISLVKSAKGAVLGFLAVQTLFLNLLPISKRRARFRVIGTAVYLVGLAIAVLGRVQLGKNWVDIEDYQILPAQSLVTSGVYRYIRHPIYAGDILLLTGLELALNSWLVLGVSIPLLVAVRNARREEALLSWAFPEYDAYCRRTKRFIPFVV